MQSLDNCEVLELKNIRKQDVVHIGELQFFFRKSKNLTKVYEVRTKRLILVSLRDKNTILNYLVERIGDIEEAINNFESGTKALFTTESN